jgi:MinD-like ATPase involved in chromosome partitioning or flagellar assembly
MQESNPVAEVSPADLNGTMNSPMDMRRVQPPPLRRAIRPSERLHGHFADLVLQLEDWVSSAGRPPALGVAGLRRGAGVSTVAFNLAAAFARKSSAPVALVEADFGRPLLTMPGRRFAGLSDILSGGCRLEQCLQPAQVANLEVLAPGSATAEQAFGLDFELLRPLVAEGFAQHALVVVDLPPLAKPSPAWSLLRGLTGVLLVLDEDGLEPAEGVALRRELERTGASLVGLVMNKMESAPGKGW